MRCRECPYGQEDFNRRIYNYQKIINEQGIPNNIYHNLQPEDATDEFEKFVWCEKTGGKVYWAGYCTDFYEEDNVINYKNRSKQNRRNKRERDKKYKNHLKYLYEVNSNKYRSPVWYIDEIFVGQYSWIKTPKPYYKRLYRGKRSKYLKRQSNKAIRRYKKGLSDGWNCHRLYDFWWEYD